MNQQRPKHIGELDGVRAIAVGLVLITHLFGNAELVPQHVLSSLPAPLLLIVTHGWLGVDLFFVLSGFLITSILLEAKGQRDYFRGFYLRRALRIMPLYYTVLVVLISVYGYRSYSTYWNFALGLSANLAGLTSAKIPAAAGPMWSLAVEEQFYLFWPFVVAMLSRRLLTIVAIGIMLIEPLVRHHFGANQIFYPWCRFDGLAMGALLALWFSGPGFDRSKTLWMSAALAGAATAILVATGPFGGFAEGPTSTAIRISEASLLFGAFVSVAIALRDSRLTVLFRSRPVRFVADLSFCLYLIHVPLVQVFEYVWHAFFPGMATWNSAALVLVRGLVVVIASVGVASLSRRYLELPFIRLKTVLMPPSPRLISREVAMVERPAR